jgi:hypothetical protein
MEFLLPFLVSGSLLLPSLGLAGNASLCFSSMDILCSFAASDSFIVVVNLSCLSSIFSRLYLRFS